MKNYDAVIAGAGAAGLLAGGLLARAGLSVALVEKKRPATKLRITGKGRCNLTNDSPPETFIANLVGGKKFMYSSAGAFTSADVIELFGSLGVKLKTERGQRVFPASDDANEVAQALIGYASGCELITGAVSGITVNGSRAEGVTLSGGRKLEAKAVILATGGASYPGTGSTGDGYRLAAAAGHNIVPPAPALCGIQLEGDFFKELQGLSLKNVRLVCEDGRRKIFSELGEAQFTHFGISGPLALSLSSLINRLPLQTLRLYIDFKPALTREVLDRRLLREIAINPNRELKTMLCSLLPRALAPVVAERSGGSVKLNSLTVAQREGVIDQLKQFSLTIRSLRPIAEGIVTAGGVDTREIDPKTMASRLVEGLYFAGEVIDIDGLTGGFNLQAAFSTAYAASNGVIKYVKGEQDGSNCD